MPLAKRVRYTKKTPTKRAKVPRTLSLSLNSQLVHKHVVTCSSSTTGALTILNPTGGVAVFQYGATQSANMALAFQLNAVAMYMGGVFVAGFPLPNVTELVALYDTYVIEKVEVSIWSSSTVAQVGNVKQDNNPTGSTAPPINYATQPLPLIGWTVDMDDSSNTSFTDLQQYSSFKCKQLGQGIPIRQTIYPCARDDLAGATGQGRVYGVPINCSSSAVNHYGLKLCVDGFKAANLAENALCTFLSIQTKYHLKMIATR